MQVIKRDGTIVEYNSEKINVAISKANKEVSKKEKATQEEIDSISPGVKGQKVFMKLPIKCEEGWILRRKKRD